MLEYPQSKTKPWIHQINCWNFGHSFSNLYIYHEMGCGKTKTAVDFCTGWDAKKILIICPKKVIGVWPSQFYIHGYEKRNILALEDCSINKHSNLLKDFLANHINNNFVVVLNYERFWRSPIGPSYNENNRIIDVGILNKIKWDVLIVDEAHRIKSPNGTASWAMLRLSKNTQRKLFLSGTPMPNSPLDIYAQFRTLDPTIFGTRFASFKNKYCILGGFKNKQVIEYINQEDLQQKFYKITHHANLKDAVDLPEVNDIFIKCNLSENAKRIYQSFEKDLIAEYDNGVISTDNALTKLLRLAQLAGGHLRMDDGTHRIIDSNKIETAIEVIKDLPLQNKIIVFARFTSEIRRIKAELERIGRKPGEVSGKHPMPNDIVGGKWLATEHDALVVQIQAGGEGLDFTCANYAFYLSKGYSLGQIKQSRARLHRPGQNQKTFFYHILARGTVDIKIEQAIKIKTEITETILDLKTLVMKSLKEPTNND